MDHRPWPWDMMSTLQAIGAAKPIWVVGGIRRHLAMSKMGQLFVDYLAKLRVGLSLRDELHSPIVKDPEKNSSSCLKK